MPDLGIFWNVLIVWFISGLVVWFLFHMALVIGRRNWDTKYEDLNDERDGTYEK